MPSGTQSRVLRPQFVPAILPSGGPCLPEVRVLHGEQKAGPPNSALAAIVELAQQAGLQGSAVRRALLDGLSDSSGLSPLALEVMVDQFAVGWSPAALRAALKGARDRRAVVQSGLVAVLAPANVPAAAWQAVLEPLLAGNRVRVRASGRDPEAVTNLRRALALVDATLAARVEVLSLPREDPRLWTVLLEGARCLSVQGNARTLQAVRDQCAQMEWKGTLRAHGEMASCAWIDARVWRRRSRVLARRLARDILEVDGRGCMSLRALVWCGLDAAELTVAHAVLARALDEQAVLLPAGRVPIDVSARWGWLGEEWTARRDLGAGLLLDRRPDGWLVTARESALVEEAWPGPGARCAVGVAVTEAAEGAAFLGRDRGSWSTLAWAGAVADRPAVIAAMGVSRVCQPGSMQAPRPDQPHDGWAPLQGYLR